MRVSRLLSLALDLEIGKKCMVAVGLPWPFRVDFLNTGYSGPESQKTDSHRRARCNDPLLIEKLPNSMCLFGHE